MPPPAAIRADATNTTAKRTKPAMVNMPDTFDQ